MLLRTYARGAEVVLTVVAMAGFLGLPVLEGGEPLLFLGTAAIFAYVGFWNRDDAVIRAVIGGLGVLYLISGVLLAISLVALELPFESRGYVETIGLAAFGGISVVCARALPCEDGPSRSDEVHPQKGWEQREDLSPAKDQHHDGDNHGH